jgi:Outer membrane protein beta-barrel domain
VRLIAECAVPVAGVLALALFWGARPAQGETSWDGVYAGVNAGAGANAPCASWALSGLPPATAAVFDGRTCPSNDRFVGGVQIGDAFQYRRLVWALGADFDAWSAGSYGRSFRYTGNVSPPGTYTLSGRLSPSGFGIIGPRIGYAGDHWLPYLKVGAIITGGPRANALSYTPAGTAKSIASFSGGRSFASAGWVTGGGVELVLSGPWSFSAEYARAALGNGSGSVASCAGSASACAPFSGISLDSAHNGFTANLFRIGINYWFGY